MIYQFKVEFGYFFFRTDFTCFPFILPLLFISTISPILHMTFNFSTSNFPIQLIEQPWFELVGEFYGKKWVNP